MNNEMKDVQHKKDSELWNEAEAYKKELEKRGIWNDFTGENF